MSRAPHRVPSLLALLALLSLAAPAAAHAFLPGVLDVRALDGGLYQIAWKPASSRSEAFATAAVAAPVFPPSCHPVAPPAPTEGTWLLDCGPAGLAGLPLGVHGLSAGADAVIRFTAPSGTMVTAVLREDTPDFVVPAPGATTALAVARTYLGAGVEHILTGVDHLLFVLGLLLLVTRAEAARPAVERRPGRALLRTVTAFTLAHSLTLALSVLGVIRLPPAPVEATIALSIGVLAVELSRPLSPSARERAAVGAFTFGLLHGFGFAGALRALGLPDGQIPLALLSFNLGVELGQLAFVALALGVLHLARGLLARAPRGAARIPAYVLGSLAAYWCCERIASFWS